MAPHRRTRQHRPASTGAWQVLVGLLALSACAAPHPLPPGHETVLPTLREDHAIMEDGYRLPVARWLPAEPPRAVVLALHGFNDYHRAFASVGPVLAARKIALYAYDQRGFGTTEGRGLWPGAARLVMDARIMARLLRAEYPDRPLYLMGESMGGAVVMLLLATTRSTPADGAVLIAPAVWARDTMPWPQRVALWLGSRLMPDTRLTGASLKIRASDNEALLRRLGADPLVIHATRIDTLQGLTDLMDQALSAAARLTSPTLILYGRHDQIIPRRPVCRMLGLLPPGAPWRFVLYPEGYHMLTRDLQGTRVIEDIATWLGDPRAALPSRREISRQQLARLLDPHCEWMREPRNEKAL